MQAQVRQVRHGVRRVRRVEKDTTGEAHCTGQYFDMWGCIDKCVAPTLFKHTK